jgi:hypothetical protein
MTEQRVIDTLRHMSHTTNDFKVAIQGTAIPKQRSRALDLIAAGDARAIEAVERCLTTVDEAVAALNASLKERA